MAALRLAGAAGYRQFERLLNSDSAAAREELKRLPGFVGVDPASTAGSSNKHAALRSMEQADVDILPVVDGQRRFVGTVSRPALTARLILFIAEQLEARLPGRGCERYRQEQ